VKSIFAGSHTQQCWCLSFFHLESSEFSFPSFFYFCKIGEFLLDGKKTMFSRNILKKYFKKVAKTFATKKSLDDWRPIIDAAEQWMSYWVVGVYE